MFADLIDTILTQRRVPAATYRLQFNRDFTFRDAQDLVPYLHELGISDCYASPILKARPGSLHGYDICDHGQINPDLGGEADFESFVAALQQHGMGLILDTVPNHMGINHPSNGWWMDVLENGPSSICAPYFDIDWHPVNPDLDNKVLLPLLEDQYGTVLEGGKIRLAYEDGAVFLYYYDIKLPVAPRTYTPILEYRLDQLTQLLGEEHEQVLELHSILTALSYLPPRKELPPKKIIERNREKEIIKRRIAALVNVSPEVRAMIEATVHVFNGTAGDPQSFSLLDQLLEQQAYRLAYWRVATEEINYRRFFDINELAAIRVENPKVFRDTHRLIFRLLAEGKVTGLRIDHPDGLWDPTSYFHQLQANYLVQRVRATLGPDRADAGLEEAVAVRLTALRQGGSAEPPPWPLFVVAEKILGDNEPLPEAWAVAGTTGYDFLNAVNGLFVNQANREAFDAIYSQFIGRWIDFHELVNSCQKIVMLVSMASEVYALAHQLDRISERNRRYRDFTLNSLTFAIREIVAALLIYRTYITGPEAVTPRDRKFIEEAVEKAKNQNPRTAEAIFDFIRDTLLLRNLPSFRPEDRPRLLEWTMKFQQLTGPVLAKGLEDTAFYAYNRLASLTEVGSHPEHFGVTVAEFHQQNADRLQKWPHAMLASSTHDTKRSEDVRVRLNVLSELPDEWRAALTRWYQLNSAKKTLVEGQPAPDRNDEYLLYQTLLGAWPPGPLTAESLAAFRERITGYMHKATKEAKVHTSWINPEEAYDAAVRDFVSRVLPDQLDDPFLHDLLAFQRRLAFFGYFSGLAQLLLKLTCPGVPDFYQGTELWDFSLVDPDNRRPVDYQLRRELVTQLRSRIEQLGSDLRPLTRELLADLPDGRSKLYLIFRTLNLRRAHQALFAHGSYQPLEASEEKAEHVCAFTRSLGAMTILVAVPRLVVRLTGGDEQPPLGSPIWRKTRLALPPGEIEQTYHNLYTGELLTVDRGEDAPSLPLAKVFRHFPVALLLRCGKEVA
jgi:(1->4)-alpha-D-glucan 1-alpha-D-glucosylmutase